MTAQELYNKVQDFREKQKDENGKKFGFMPTLDALALCYLGERPYAEVEKIKGEVFLIWTGK